MDENIPVTFSEALELWDSNQPITSVSLGGIGPGHEMALQGLAFEIIRKLYEVDRHATDTAFPLYQERCGEVLAQCKSLPSGEMLTNLGFARAFAYSVWTRGYREALQNSPAEKYTFIQVCKLDLRK